MFPYKIDEHRPFVPVTFAILAVSDTRTLEDDTSGALLKEMIEGAGHRVADRAIVKDDRDAISGKVKEWVGEATIDVVITTGGTGFSGRDVTPEAIEPLFDKKMDGFSVLFHQYSSTTIGTSSIQSRATAGLIGSTFVFCLPGSRGACRDAWDAILKYQFDSRHAPCNFIEVMPRLQEK